MDKYHLLFYAMNDLIITLPHHRLPAEPELKAGARSRATGPGSRVARGICTEVVSHTTRNDDTVKVMR